MRHVLKSALMTLPISLFFLLLLIPMGIYSGFSCLSNPCMHGVCLDDLNSTYFCYCIDGYTGIQCQTNWNECWSSPCENGGSCIDGIAAYNCTCPPGYVGDRCEIDYNECESNPCWNNGTCLDAPNGYLCACPPGYSGPHCEIDIAVCNSTNETRCFNGGMCQEGAGDTFACQCAPGWGDPLCRTEIDECRSQPCQNGAVCIDMFADYACACLFGYAGRNCEETVQMCDTNPCENNALCLLEDYGAKCYCVPDFHGDLCQFQYDECQLGPGCTNGGTCIDGIDSFTCSCPPDLTGDRCECLLLRNGDLDCGYIAPSTSSMSTAQTTAMTTDATVMETTTILELGTEESTTIQKTSTIETVTETVETVTELSTQPIGTSEPISTTSESISQTISSREPSSQPISTTAEPIYQTSSTSESISQPISTIQPISTTLEPISTTLQPISQPISTTEAIYGTITEFPSTQTQRITEIETTIRYLNETPTTLTFTSPEGRESDIFDITEKSTILTTPIDTTLEVLSTETNAISESTTGTAGSTLEPIEDCTKKPCKNGGTCVFSSDNQYKCLCPFDAEGRFCEIQLGIQKAAFSGTSYLKHQIPNNRNMSVEFSAKTLTTSGLLFYSSTDDTYMVLFIENGHLKFKFSCGYQTMLLSELRLPVNNGYLFEIETRLEFNSTLKQCNAFIKINDTISMMGNQVALSKTFSKPNAWIYLGGVPMGFKTASAIPKNGFFGCISSLKISGRKVNIFKEAQDGFGVNECSSLACLSNPCLNGGSCNSKGEEWHCSCKNGFLGRMCEESVCQTNPCLFGGTCIPFSGSGYICLCPFGKHGHFCENDLKISEPYFSSSIRGLSSFVAYPLPEGISDSMQLRFKFVPSTMDQIAILMFMGQKGQHDFYSDHIALSFVKGYIMLTWNLGSGPRRIFTNEPLEVGRKEYLMEMGRNGRRAWLSVDGSKNITGRSPGNLVKLDVVPLLYLGGHSHANFSTLPHDLPLHSGFSGCIHDVELTSGNLVIPLQRSRETLGRAVGQCGTSECYEQGCQNEAICLHHASTFMCLCQDGWFGPMCSFRNNPCDEKRHKCAAGATCVPVMFDYECDCPLGKSGDFCEKDENITDVHFTGRRSFLSLPPFETEENNFNIELEIRPLQDNGIVLFTDNSEASFISLELQSGVLQLKIRPNLKQAKEPTKITSSKILVKGLWYKIQMGLFGKRVYLSVDKVINSAVLPVDYGVTLSNDAMFLGGLPDLSASPLTLPVPFQGCIRHFLINNQQIPLTNSNIIKARNVNDCDGTPCGKDACLNGGTCFLDAKMRPHCSCPGPFYGNSCEKTGGCDEKLCKNTGNCENAECSCKIGWHGAYCEHQITVTTPRFRGKGYLVVENSDKKRQARSLELKNLFLNLTTVKKDGLVVWSRQKDGKFIGIGIERGFLKIVHSHNGLDTNALNLPFYYKITDGLWHDIEVNFAPFKIKIDRNEIPPEKELGNSFSNSVFTDGLFYIGGLPEENILKETNGTFLNTFEGCIEGFAANGGDIIRDFSNFDGKHVDVCNVI